MHEYAFDVKAFTVVRVRADNEEGARKILAELDLHDEATVTEWSVDGNPELFEVDGLDPLFGWNPDMHVPTDA